MAPRTILVFAILVLVSTACSSSPEPIDDTEPTEQPETAETDTPAERTDAQLEAARYMHTGSGPVVFKIRPADLEDRIGPALDTDPAVAARFSGELDEFLGALFEGPGTTEPYPPGIDRDRPAYFSRQLLGEPSYFEVLRYGSVLQPREVSPWSLHLRYLFPADDPEQTARALRNDLDDNAETAVTAGDHFVRLDVVEPLAASLHDQLSGPDASPEDYDGNEMVERVEAAIDAQLDRAVAHRTPSGDLPRTTPALKAFEESDAPVAAYTRSDDLLVTMIGEMMVEARDAMEMATPENRHRLLSRWIAQSKNVLRAAPRAQFEHEDTALAVRLSDGGGLSVDAISTNTRRGREVASYIGDATRLDDIPALEDDAADRSAPPTARLEWNFEFGALTDDLPPRIGLDSPRRVADHLRGGGIWAYLQLLTPVPSLIPRLLTAEHDLDVPSAGRLTTRFEIDDPDPTPTDLRVAGIARFQEDTLTGGLPSYLRTLETNLEAAGIDVDLAVSETDDRDLRVRVGEGTDATEDAEIDDALMVARLPTPEILRLLGADSGLADRAESAGLDPARLKWRTTDDATIRRLELGEADLAELTVPTIEDFEPAETEPACIDDVVGAAIEVFENLADVPPTADYEQLERLFEDYDAISRECADQAPDHAEQLRVARARVRSLARMRLWGHEAPDEIEERLHEHQCEIGDPVLCD